MAPLVAAGGGGVCEHPAPLPTRLPAPLPPPPPRPASAPQRCGADRPRDGLVAGRGALAAGLADRDVGVRRDGHHQRPGERRANYSAVQRGRLFRYDTRIVFDTRCSIRLYCEKNNWSRYIDNWIDDLAPVSRNIVQNEPSRRQSILGKFATDTAWHLDTLIYQHVYLCFESIDDCCWRDSCCWSGSDDAVAFWRVVWWRVRRRRLKSAWRRRTYLLRWPSTNGPTTHRCRSTCCLAASPVGGSTGQTAWRFAQCSTKYTVKRNWPWKIIFIIFCFDVRVWQRQIVSC